MRHLLRPARILILTTALALLAAAPAAALEPPALKTGEVNQGVWIEYMDILGARSDDPAAAIPKFAQLFDRLEGNDVAAGKVHIGLRLATDQIGLWRTEDARAVLTTCAALAAQRNNMGDEAAYAYIRLAELASRDGRETDAADFANKALAANATDKRLVAYASVLSGQLQLQRGDTEAAAATLRDARTTAQQAGDIESLTLYLQTLSRYNLGKGDTTAARKCHELALQQLDALPPGQQQQALARRLRAEVFFEQALFLWRQFEREAAVGALRNAFVYAEAAGEKRLSGTIWLQLGQLYFEIAAWDQAEKMVDQAARTMADGKYKDAPLAVRIAALRGRIALARGRASEAEKLLGDALTLLGDDGPPRLRAELQRYLADLAVLRGAWQAALDRRREAATISNRIGDARGEIDALFDLGTTYARIGNATAATTVLNRAATLAEGAGARRDLARVLTGLGAVSNTLEPLVRAAKIAKDISDTRLQARILLNAAEQQLVGGKPDSASTFTTEALSLVGNRRTDLTWRAKLLSGRILLIRATAGGRVDRNKVNDSIRWLAAALEDAQGINDPQMLADTYTELGRAAMLSEQTDRSLEFYTAAAARLESARQTLAGNENRTALVAQNAEIFSAIVDLCVQKGDIPAAFQWSETGKARTFLDQLAEGRDNIRRGVDPALLEREAALGRQLAALQRTRMDLLSQADPSAEKLAAINAEIGRADVAATELRAEIRKKHPAWASLHYPEPATLKDVQAALAPTELLIAYSIGPRRSHAFAITREGIAHGALPAADELTWQIGYQRDLVIAGTPIVLEHLAGIAWRLGETLITPFAATLKTHQDLVIAPDGPLHYLPFETLATAAPPAKLARYAEVPWLLSSVGSVRYVQSASVLVWLGSGGMSPAANGGGNPTPDARPFLVALGDPIYAAERRGNATGTGGSGGTGDTAPAVFDGFARLPNTAREVDAIVRGAADRGQVVRLVREEASEADLRTHATHARYLHIATHGVLDERNPAFSGLVLTQPAGDAAAARAGENDGYLYLMEIFNLKVDAEVVVLSACQTGLGRLVNGEGVEGLTRAFMYAGAPRLVVSLWSVDDASTATLMTAFYDRLWQAGGDAASRTTARALAEAKRQLIRSDRFSAPYFWSPFVAIGDR
ncbi:MAG: CHAT domain-containing protein [Planctomycetota bacterium]